MVFRLFLFAYVEASLRVNINPAGHLGAANNERSFQDESANGSFVINPALCTKVDISASCGHLPSPTRRTVSLSSPSYQKLCHEVSYVRPLPIW